MITAEQIAALMKSVALVVDLQIEKLQDKIFARIESLPGLQGEKSDESLILRLEKLELGGLVGKDGVPGKDGRDGRDADVTLVKTLVDTLSTRMESLERLPGAPGKDGVAGANGVPGKDGISLDSAEIKGFLSKIHDLEQKIALIPSGDRGDQGPPGQQGLPGKDYDPAHLEMLKAYVDARLEPIERREPLPGPVGAPGLDGQKGADGLGFEDFEIDYDGERLIKFILKRNDTIKEFAFNMPVLIDKGVYRYENSYQKGDVVTYGGSMWIAQTSTNSKPDAGDKTWRLSVKCGRDGREGIIGKQGPSGKDGINGIDGKTY